jgi:hypothetical protein
MNESLAKNEISAKIRKLALEVAACPEIEKAMGGKHECSGVVEWQRGQFRDMGVAENEITQRMHRPEAWAGNLETAKIVWLSSNPSFSDEESFPTWDKSWSEDQIADFVTNRFSSDVGRGYGAGDEPGKSWDKSIGKSGKLSKKRVSTWSVLRNRTSVILKKPVKEVFASRDYVMTEVVHCKSPGEKGLSNECVVHCSKRWMSQILDSSICSAGLIVVSGDKAAYALRLAMPDLPLSWGPSVLNEQKGGGPRYWPKSNAELLSRVKEGTWTISEQQCHTIKRSLYGKERTLVWLPHPTGSLPRDIKNPDLIHPDLLEQWHQAANS